MKPEAKAKFSEVLDIVKSKELWRTAKCLVELSAPAMNLLRLADSDIPGVHTGTGKIYHEMFKTSKILEPRSKSADHAYIPTATHEAISAKWLHLLKTPKLHKHQNGGIYSHLFKHHNGGHLAMICDADELKMFAWYNEDAWAITASSH